MKLSDSNRFSYLSFGSLPLVCDKTVSCSSADNTARRYSLILPIQNVVVSLRYGFLGVNILMKISRLALPSNL